MTSNRLADIYSSIYHHSLEVESVAQNQRSRTPGEGLQYNQGGLDRELLPETSRPTARLDPIPVVECECPFCVIRPPPPPPPKESNQRERLRTRAVKVPSLCITQRSIVDEELTRVQGAAARVIQLVRSAQPIAHSKTPASGESASDASALETIWWNTVDEDLRRFQEAAGQSSGVVRSTQSTQSITRRRTIDEELRQIQKFAGELSQIVRSTQPTAQRSKVDEELRQVNQAAGELARVARSTQSIGRHDASTSRTTRALRPTAKPFTSVFGNGNPCPSKDISESGRPSCATPLEDLYPITWRIFTGTSRRPPQPSQGYGLLEMSVGGYAAYSTILYAKPYVERPHHFALSTGDFAEGWPDRPFITQGQH